MAPFDRRLSSVAVLLGSLTVAGCASRAPEGLPAQASAPQAYYRTGFPVADISRDLERVLPSVVRVQVQGFYDTYVFDERDAPTDEELRQGGSDILARATTVGTTTASQAATAIVIAALRGSGTLVTTEHGITLPEMTFDYFGVDRAPSGGATAVERLSIKRRQMNTAVGVSFVEPFEVLVRDTDKDLALIGVMLPDGASARELRALSVPFGEPRRLSWGSLVYVVGHPGGHQMVTRAIVSRPDLGSADAFLTDGLLNEGTSGAAILAVRGASDELEWVGVARAAATRVEHRLVPQAGAERSQPPNRPYDGPIYLREDAAIRYGITFSIPVGEIRELVRANRALLAAAGYPAPDF